MDREDDDLRAASAAAEQLVAKVIAQRDRIAPLVPDLDPGDLMLIIESLLRPFGSGRRFLLSEVRPGVYVA
jgi:hypothetical protein